MVREKTRPEKTVRAPTTPELMLELVNDAGRGEYRDDLGGWWEFRVAQGVLLAHYQSAKTGIEYYAQWNLIQEFECP